jgi:hypothetical protein
MTIQALGFFCQDIRPEKDSMLSIVGIIPENANLTEFVPGRTVLPRLALYVRVQFEESDNVKTIRLKLQLPNGGAVDLGPVEEAIIRNSYEGSKTNNSPALHIYFRVDMSPFPIPALGWMKALVEIDGRDYLVAFVNFATGLEPKEAKEITRNVTASASASPQPS